MEQVRIIIAIALSLLIFIVWDLFFVDKNKELAPQTAVMEVSDQPSMEKGRPPAAPAEMKDPIMEAPIPEATVASNRPDRLIHVHTPLYTVVLSENRATFKSFVLKKYKETVSPTSPNLEMVDQDITNGTITLNFQSALAIDYGKTAFVTETTQDQLTVDEAPLVLQFKHTDTNGVIVEKRFRFYPDSYLIDMDVVVENHSNRQVQDKMVLSIVKDPSKEKARYGFQGPSAYVGNTLENIDLEDLDEKNRLSGNIDWIAFQDQYFISFIIPDNPVDGEIKITQNPDTKQVTTQLIQDTGAVTPGAPVNLEYGLYLGPKSIKILKSVDRKIDKAVNFGWFDFIARPCLWLMNLLHEVIPNYGVAIIVLTILTKILLWPLGTKSYKSMNEMKKIQPLMAELREKYKDDKQRMNQEVMGLYRTYKINPLGGCLPMLVQIPVFFALYRMLYEAVELRHAPFFGWINDLSAPDRLFHFDFAIPMMQPPYGIPVLTIVMGATMFLQQKMSPPMGDPAQAKMMMLMPIIFTVVFVNFSSGLVLYWLVNNLLSISQQYYIQKKYA